MQEMIAALQKKADEQEALNSTLTTQLETLRAIRQQEGGPGGIARAKGIGPVALTLTTPITAAGGRAATGSRTTDPPPLNKSNTNDGSGAIRDAPANGTGAHATHLAGQSLQ
ncbi:unnamed protein product [Microthlaspi erraticum]|uniref:Uncharacterized protein n=1 Tax=Microthlaspi erraticum TaxID=1685480 RepID=A0A6D2JPS8_9BRAS|nr:unnamed protein product [Microthlaspi erraticum]